MQKVTLIDNFMSMLKNPFPYSYFYIWYID